MRIYLFLPLLLLLGSCVGPDYKRPDIPVPPEWKNQPTQTATAEQNIDISWWHNFHDPQLDNLIEEASKANLDYLTALARIREARAHFSGVEANLFPTISGVGSASQAFFGSHFQKNAPSSASPSPSSSSSTPNSSQSSKQNVYMVGFDATWELDFFGAVQRSEESALATLESAVESARATLLSLIAEIAQNYINLRNFQHQLEAVQAIADLWRENLTLQSDLEKTGLTSQMTTATAQSSLDRARAAIPPLEANMKAAIHRLGVLLGKDPGALYDQLLLRRGSIPQTSEAVIAGLPSELICRRPDIRVSERLLASTTAQIGVSIASLFPQFQLTGNLDYQRGHLPHLLRSSSQFWQYGLNFSVPIFDFGQIRAQIDAKYAQKDEALLAYQKSILTAFEDVENGLVNYANESHRYDQLQGQVAAQERFYRLTSSRYQAGLNSYLDVLQAKILLLNTKITAIQSQATVSLNLVALYKALGGGWETYDPDKDAAKSLQ